MIPNVNWKDEKALGIKPQTHLVDGTKQSVWVYCRFATRIGMKYCHFKLDQMSYYMHNKPFVQTISTYGTTTFTHVDMFVRRMLHPRAVGERIIQGPDVVIAPFFTVVHVSFNRFRLLFFCSLQQSCSRKRGLMLYNRAHAAYYLENSFLHR